MNSVFSRNGLNDRRKGSRRESNPQPGEFSRNSGKIITLQRLLEKKKEKSGKTKKKGI